MSGVRFAPRAILLAVPRFGWALILVLAVAGGGVLLRQRGRGRDRSALRFVLEPPGTWEGVSPREREGVGQLFRDALEYGAGMAVVEGPGPDAGKAGFTQVRFRALRTGSGLAIQMDLVRPGRAPWHLATGTGLPVETFGRALEALGVNARGLGDLLPKDPRAFWVLAGITAVPREGQGPEDLRQAFGLKGDEPRSAAVNLALARFLYQDLIEETAPDNSRQQFCEESFRAALKAAPHYPRAVALFSRFKTDIGNPREALDLLFETRRAFPKANDLPDGIAYAARTSGLLAGALRILRERDQRTGPSGGGERLAENSYLYAGDWDRFEALLGPEPRGQADSVRSFYRGYARLLRQDVAGAEAIFNRPGRRVDSPQFETLSRVYGLKLSGREEEALATLRKLRYERSSLSVPDGEFTFKLAEAFATLGSMDEAFDTATRAFGQGFGCTRWYEASPFLRVLHGTPRWQGLLEHLRERQALMEQRFPLDRFR